MPPAEGASNDLANPAGPVLAPMREKTIGDTLSAKGVSWAWYAGGWNAATRDGRQDPREQRSVIYATRPGALAFQPHHQPFNYYERFAPGKPDRERHLRDYDDFVAAIDKGTRRRCRSTPVGRPTSIRYTRSQRRWHLHEPVAAAEESPVEAHGRHRHLRRTALDHLPPPQGPG